MTSKFALLATPALLLVAACGSPGTAAGGSNDAGTVQVTMNAQNTRFDPSTISARRGEKIALTLSNHDGFKHNFTISELGVNQDLDPGKTLTFVFTTRGNADVQYYCEYHRASGMTGTLNLSGATPVLSPSTSSGASAPAGTASPYSGY